MRVIAAILSGTALSDLGVVILPLILGSLVIIFGISEGVAGLVIFAELAGMATTSLILSPLLHRLNRRTIGVIGGLLVCMGNLAAFFSATAVTLFIARIIAGIGSGAILSATLAVSSEQKNVHRIFVAVSATSMAAAVVMLFYVPRLLESQGPRSVFLVMAALAAVVVVLSFWLTPWTTEGGEPRDQEDQRFNLFTLPSLLLCATYMLFSIAMNGAYFYAFQIGLSIGMEPSEIGDGLALAAIISLSGPVLASLISTRFGRLPPLILAVILNAIGVWVTTHTSSVTWFIASITLSTIMLTFAQPYFLGLAAHLVSSGRLSSAARGASTLGNTITPGVSALILLMGGSYGTIGLVAAVLSAIAVLLLLLLGTQLNKAGASDVGVSEAERD